MRTNSLSQTALSMNSGSWSPGATAHRSRITSMPSLRSRVARALTQALCSSPSHEYEMNAFGVLMAGGLLEPDDPGLPLPAILALNACPQQGGGGSAIDHA